MRVGFYAGELQSEKIGGGHTFQTTIIKGLMAASSEHEFYFYYKNEQNLFENTKNIKFINIYFEKKLIKKKIRFFKNKSKKNNEDVFNKLVTRDQIELVYFISPVYKKVDVPFIFTVWDLDHRKTPHFPEVSTVADEFTQRELFYSHAAPRASYVVIGNAEGKRQVEKFYNVDSDRIKTIPMPTPGFVYEYQEDSSILINNNLEKNKYLFYPAQFWPHKNHIRLLKALNKLKKQGSELKLVLTGSDVGNLKYIKEKVKEFNLENEVLFLGFVKKEEIISLYKNAYALTFVSFMGPDNIPPLEAMALKCPVISTGTDGMREQLRDCALFFDPTDENELVEKINLLASDELRGDLIKRGESLAKDYCAENYIKRMLELIDEFAPIRECWSSTEPYTDLKV